MAMKNPSHPGEVLREYMGKGLTISALAAHLGVTRSNLSMILNGRAGISAAMSLRLDDAFQTSEGFWLRMQTNYDLAQARKEKRRKIPALSASNLSAEASR